MKVLTNTPKKYKGAIFDLDGTLLNTIDDLADSVNAAVTGMGFPAHTQAQVMQMIGNGFRLLITRALPEDHRTDAEIEDGLHRFVAAYAEKYADKTAPYDGIPALVQALADQQVHLAVDSNKRDDYTKTLITKWFPHIAFTGVCGEREKDGIPKKPDPTAALQLAAAMGLSPEDVLFIGDSRPDMETGRNAHMDCAGVTWGFRSADELIEHGAAYLIETPAELLELF